MLFFFIGASAMVMDTPYHFTRFGQTAEMEPTFAQRCCVQGLQIIPASDPAATAFTPAELEQYPARHNWHAKDIPPALAAKVAAADLALQTFRDALLAPKTVTEETNDADAK